MIRPHARGWKAALAFSFFAAVCVLAGAPGGDLAQQQPKHVWNVPPSRVLTGADALASFKLPPGFRIELVAEEPLVQNPVAMVWDADGRLFVVEMRGYMPDMDGTGESEPVGDVVMLEDTNGDGKMDKRTVFLDGLVLPRAIAVVNGGLLIAETPNLWLCRDKDGDGKCDEKTAIFTNYGGRGAPEYQPNGLLRALDGWIYSANWGSRFRFVKGQVVREVTPSRGQWGIAQDDAGRIFTNGNSSMLHCDVIPSAYLTRNPLAGTDRRGTAIAKGSVFPGRITAGINRAYSSLGPTGKMGGVTAACGPHIYRGDALPAEFHGNAFVCEPAGNLVSRQVLTAKGAGLTATSVHGDTDFLVSTDERFRPVNFATGPDGALYVVDLHHGIIQHKNFLSAYLRDQITKRQLDKPLHLGRIFRIVHESSKPGPRPALAKATTADLVKQLAHPNGWWRDTAQQVLTDRADSAAVPLLRQLAADKTLAALHSLWTLSALDALDAATLQTAFANTLPAVRAAAIRLAEPLLRPPTADANLLTHLLPLGNDSNAQVHLQFLLTISAIADPRAEDAVLALLEKSAGDPLLRDAALTGIGGRELSVLQRILTDKKWANAAAGRKEFVAALSGLIVAGRSAERVDALMALIAKQPNGAWPQLAMLDGIADLAKAGKGTVSDKRPLKVAAEPALLAALTKSPVAKSAQGALALFTWPGKPGAIVSVTPPLTPAQELRFKEGRELYAGICGACHQPSGFGQDGLAPPLFDSEWVLGTEQHLARIVLRGMNGKVTVNKRTYEMEMPPLEVLSDAQIAAILTYLRREWGHEAAPIEPENIARIRTATKTHPTPFTADELKKIK